MSGSDAQTPRGSAPKVVDRIRKCIQNNRIHGCSITSAAANLQLKALLADHARLTRELAEARAECARLANMIDDRDDRECRGARTASLAPAAGLPLRELRDYFDAMLDYIGARENNEPRDVLDSTKYKMHLAALDVRHAIDRLLAEPAAGDGGGE